MTTSNSSTANTRTFQYFAAGAAVVALGLHAYLLKSHYDLHYGAVDGKLLCDISSTFSCSAASASRWSELLGVPLALWGLLTNLAYLVLAGWDMITEESERDGVRTSILAVSAVLVLASVVMGAISLLQLNTICPFCFGTYILSFVTAAFAFLGYRSNLKPKLKLSFLWISIAFAVSGFIMNDQFRTSYQGSGHEAAMAKAALGEWRNNPQIEIAETDPLAMGPSRADAKMTILEFADFRCGHCKDAAAPLKAFLAAHSDVRLEFYSWPLDGECNSSVQQVNNASCLLARTVWCARKNGEKGWEAHEQVFARFDEWRTTERIRENLDSIATSIGIDGAALKACADSPEAKSAIEKQAALGTSLNIRGTPAIFVNGRVLPAGSSIPVLNAVHREISSK